MHYSQWSHWNRHSVVAISITQSPEVLNLSGTINQLIILYSQTCTSLKCQPDLSLPQQLFYKKCKSPHSTAHTHTHTSSSISTQECDRQKQTKEIFQICQDWKTPNSYSETHVHLRDVTTGSKVSKTVTLESVAANRPGEKYAVPLTEP